MINFRYISIIVLLFWRNLIILIMQSTIIIKFQMQGIELTDRQKQIWNDIGDSMAASLNIKHLALQYYLQYRQSLANNKVMIEQSEKINNIMRIAYFVSEKNQVTYNMRGQKVIGVALSINEIIKKNSDFQDFFLHLKEMLKVITIQDSQVEQQIQSSLKKFKFTMTFHHKFVSTFNKIKPTHTDANLARSLLWLLFISSKQTLNSAHDDIIQATCLMASCFIYYLKQAIRYQIQNGQKQRMFLEDNKFGGQLNNDNQIEHVILEYFRIKDIDKYQSIEKIYYELIDNLKNKLGTDTLFFHSYQRNLDTVYKKMDQIYQKRLTDHSIDERHFLKQRINNILIANRFTPFGGKRAVGKNKNPQSTQIFSHRILNYENDQTQTTKLIVNQKNTKQTRQKCGENLLRNLVANKTPVRNTPLIRATPTTNAMQMYNWVLQKSSYHRYQSSNKELPLNLILKDNKSLNQSSEDIFKLIYGLWRDLCDNQNERNINSKNSYIYLILSVQIVYYVKNFSHTSLENMVKNFQLTWLDIWEKIDIVLRYDNAMPRSIKQHLLAVQTNIIVKQLWSMNQPPFHIFSQDSTNNIETLDRLYNRIIHQIVYQIYFLSKKIPIIQQQQTNLIFMISQYAIINHPQILHYRNLYQIILCSFNVLARVHKLNLTFTSIVYPFVDLNAISKQYYAELIQKISGNSQPGKTITIVEFYNQIFIKATKQIALMIRYQDGPLQKQFLSRNINNGKIMNSSVKDLLPKRMVIMAERRTKSTMPNTPQSPLQTPMTQALLAYNQSPLLKQKRIKNLMNCIDGKRLLSKTNNKIQDDKSRQQTLKQTKALINQKWKNNRSPDLKFGSTIRKTGINNQSK